MTVKVTNNGFSTLASGINNSVTTIALASGEGARFPNPSSPDVFYATIIDTSNNLEVVKVTARSTDSLTVVRAQDNTSARAFATGDRFELRPVAKLFEDIQAEARDLNGAELVLDADGDTSITADTDDQIDFKTGGTDRMAIDSSGNVGIGTSSADGKLHIETASSGATANTAANELVLEGTGNVGMSYLTSTTGANRIYFGDSDNALSGVIKYDHNLDSMLFSSNASERMRIDSNGDVMIGSTSTTGTEKLHVANTGGGDVSMFRTPNSGSTFIIVFRNANGNVGSIKTSSSSTSFNTSSDYRLKENVSYTWDATTRLKQLRPCRFNWISDDTDTTLDGFLAHEVSSIVPEAISGTKDATKVQDVYDDDGNVTGTETVPDYQGIDQSKLVPLLVKTIQEQQAVIEDLQSRVTTLEG
tara:strand:+ start:1075 stop:2325 length:1251 start_codon:yes stop_codon:yes gene_type:complete